MVIKYLIIKNINNSESFDIYCNAKKIINNFKNTSKDEIDDLFSKNLHKLANYQESCEIMKTLNNH